MLTTDHSKAMLLMQGHPKFGNVHFESLYEVASKDRISAPTASRPLRLFLVEDGIWTWVKDSNIDWPVRSGTPMPNSVG